MLHNISLCLLLRWPSGASAAAGAFHACSSGRRQSNRVLRPRAPARPTNAQAARWPQQQQQNVAKHHKPETRNFSSTLSRASLTMATTTTTTGDGDGQSHQTTSQRHPTTTTTTMAMAMDKRNESCWAKMRQKSFCQLWWWFGMSTICAPFATFVLASRSRCPRTF